MGLQSTPRSVVSPHDVLCYIGWAKLPSHGTALKSPPRPIMLISSRTAAALQPLSTLCSRFASMRSGSWRVTQTSNWIRLYPSPSQSKVCVASLLKQLQDGIRTIHCSHWMGDIIKLQPQLDDPIPRNISSMAVLVTGYSFRKPPQYT